MRPKMIYLDLEAKQLMEKGGTILICNHNSATNGPLLMSALHASIVPVAAKDKYEKKLWQPWLEALECIPCDRYNMDMQWLRKAVAALKKGKNILIFPEGKVRKDGMISPFKPGFALLSVLSGAPVIPLTICGRYTPLQPARISIDACRIIDSRQGHSADYLNSQCDELRNIVVHNYSEYKGGSL